MRSKDEKREFCPCSSGNPYVKCCEPFHLGKAPETALQLMRSRYSAYALSVIDYVIETTHPGSPQYSENKSQWAKAISEFCAHTEFRKLEILGSQERGTFGTVTFVAHLFQKGKDVSYTERSYFEKINGRWLYLRGQLAAGTDPNLITTHQLRLLPLAYYGDPILRKKAEPVGAITSDLKALIEEMIETMDACDGLGIAAPQVHHSIRLFVIRQPIVGRDGEIDVGDVVVFINPKISEPSKETWKAQEGCLSIPSIRSDVERANEITVEYLTVDGETIKRKVSGWEARVIMHEFDHIEGVLFIDRLPEAEQKKLEPTLNRMKKRIHHGKEF
jgi:peptide deformylase